MVFASSLDYFENKQFDNKCIIEYKQVVKKILKTKNSNNKTLIVRGILKISK